MLCDGHYVRMKLKNNLCQKIAEAAQNKKTETNNYTLKQHVGVHTVQKHLGKQLYRHKATVTSVPHKNIYQHTDNLDQYTDFKYNS